MSRAAGTQDEAQCQQGEELNRLGGMKQPVTARNGQKRSETVSALAKNLSPRTRPLRHCLSVLCPSLCEGLVLGQGKEHDKVIDKDKDKDKVKDMEHNWAHTLTKDRSVPPTIALRSSPGSGSCLQ